MFDESSLLAKLKFNKALKWLIALAGALLVASIIMLWYGGPAFSESGFNVMLKGPDQAIAGDEIIYTIVFENKTKVDLHDIHLTFFYPKDMVVVKDGSIQSGDSEILDIERLRPGESKTKEFKGYMVGDKGNIKNARARFSYLAGSFRSQFEKNVELSTTITDVPVAMTLVAPPNALSGQEITYILDYRNTTPDIISDLQIKFNYPDGFVVRQTAPAASGGSDTWSVASINPNQGARITVRGTLKGFERESKSVSVTLKRKLGNEFVNFEKITSSTVLISPLLKATISVNGSRGYTSFPGDTLNYTIAYQNTSTHTLTGLTLTAVLTGEMWDLDSITTDSGYFDAGARIITWNASGVSDFSSLGPNQKGDVNFRAKVKSSSAGSGANSSLLKVAAKLSTPNVPQGVDGDEISTEDSLITRITTQPTVRQTLFYQDAAFSKSGPMPPQVGSETVFTIHWQIMNPGNMVNQVKISAVLPAGVAWKGVTSIPEGIPAPSYNRNSAEVVWNIGSLPAGAGVNEGEYEASFQVSVKPSTAQRGSPILLTKSGKLTGVDATTNQTILVTLLDLNTNNTVDRNGEGIVE